MDSESKIVWQMRGLVFMAWGLSIVVTAFIGLVGYFLLADFSLQKPPTLVEGAFGLGLALLGVFTVSGLWYWAVKVAHAAYRFGDAEFEPTTVPARLGERLRGRIKAQASLSTNQAINLVLQCWGSRSGGGDSGSDQWLRWDSESLMTADAIEQNQGVLTLPVDLEIPANQLPTGEAEKRWDISWTLKMNLVPNTAYKPAFGIPVESSKKLGANTQGSLQPPGQSSLNVRNRILAMPDSAGDNGTTPARPPHARVRVEPQASGGVKITPAKSITASIFFAWCVLTLPLWVVLPAWGLAELKGTVSPPLIAYLVQFGVAFGAATVLNGLPVLGQVFVNNSFLVTPDGVSVKRLLRTKRFPAGHFMRCEAIGNSNDSWRVSLERPDPGIFGGLVVAIVATESEARWLVYELSSALRRA